MLYARNGFSRTYLLSMWKTTRGRLTANRVNHFVNYYYGIAAKHLEDDNNPTQSCAVAIVDECPSKTLPITQYWSCTFKKYPVHRYIMPYVSNTLWNQLIWKFTNEQTSKKSYFWQIALEFKKKLNYTRVEKKE